MLEGISDSFLMNVILWPVPALDNKLLPCPFSQYTTFVWQHLPTRASQEHEWKAAPALQLIWALPHSFSSYLTPFIPLNSEGSERQNKPDVIPAKSDT